MNSFSRNSDGGKLRWTRSRIVSSSKVPLFHGKTDF